MIDIDILPASSESKGGDSVLIRIGDFGYGHGENNTQQTILIDSGYKENAERIESYLLEHYKTDTIDLVILTHPDMDHVSGFYEILQRGNIRIKATMIHDPWSHKNALLKKSADGRRTVNSIEKRLDDALAKLSEILEKVGNKNTEPFESLACLDFGITILGPSKSSYQRLLHQFPGMDGEGERQTISHEIYDNEVTYTEEMSHFLKNPITSAKNDSSAIILLHDKAKRPIALFTGDAGVDGISKALDYADGQGINYRNVQLLQIPHHGSIKNINSEIISRISPLRAYVSAPPKNPEHPSRLVLNYLTQKSNIPVHHIMDRSGTLFRFDGAPKRPGWNSPAPAVARFDTVKKLLRGLFK